MIKFDIHKCEDGEHKGKTKCELVIKGDASTIISESCTFIEKIRETMDEHGAANGMTFKAAIVSRLFDIPMEEAFAVMLSVLFELNKDGDNT